MDIKKYNQSKITRFIKELIELEKESIEIIEAKTFLRAWSKKSNPILLKCNDGKKYVVKGKKTAGRQIINDQIVARLGTQINAPVGIPTIINISQELIDTQPNNFEDFDAGTAHGTEYIADCFDSYELLATDEKNNRIRLITLALLFGWTHANDHQFIYQRTSPYTIYSVDHGHFFPNPPNWRIEHLDDDSPATLDAFFDQCCFLQDELNRIYDILISVTEKEIVRAVSCPRTEWGITFEEKLGMINYLTKRKQELQDHLKSKLASN